MIELPEVRYATARAIEVASGRRELRTWVMHEPVTFLVDHEQIIRAALPRTGCPEFEVDLARGLLIRWGLPELASNARPKQAPSDDAAPAALVTTAGETWNSRRIRGLQTSAPVWG